MGDPGFVTGAAEAVGRPMVRPTALPEGCTTLGSGRLGSLLAAKRERAQRLASFYAALDTVIKTVTILIDHDDFIALKTNNYALCFAKSVAVSGGAGSYNVVWQCLIDYYHSTSFAWTPQYSLFGTTTFAENGRVNPQTNLQSIAVGQQCVLDSKGWLDAPTAGGPPTAVTLVNQYRLIHPGISQISTLNGTTGVTPIYVDKDGVLPGSTSLTPEEKLLVWFEQNVQTSAMFSSVRAQSVEVDLTNSSEACRQYSKGAWSVPPGALFVHDSGLP